MIDISTKTNDYQDIDDASTTIRSIIDNAGEYMIPAGDNEQTKSEKQTMVEYYDIRNRIGCDDDYWDIDRWLIFPETFRQEFAQKLFYETMFFVDFRNATYEDYRWPLDFIDWNEATTNLFDCIDYNTFDWNGETFIAIYDWESCI